MKAKLLIAILSVYTLLSAPHVSADTSKPSGYDYYPTISPSSLPSLDESSARDAIDDLKAYVTVGEKLVSSFDSLIGDYEGVLKSFRDYREGCKNSPSLEKGDGEIFKRGAIPCSTGALVSFDDRLKTLGDKLDQLEGKLVDVKRKIQLANSQIKNISGYNYINTLVSDSEKKMDDARTLQEQANNTENGG